MPAIITTKNIKHPNTFSISKGETLLISQVPAINQSIRLILTTAPGELFGDPDFGCRLHEYLLDFVGDELSFAAREEIARVLTKYEPRIIVTTNDITAEVQEETVFLNIAYTVRYTKYNTYYQYKIENQEGL